MTNPVMRPKVLMLTSTWPGSQQDIVTPRFIRKLVENLGNEFSVVVSTQQLPGSKPKENFGSTTVFRYRYAPESFQVLSSHGGITNTLKSCRSCWLLLPGFLLAQVVAVIRLILREKPDIVHAHWIVPQGLVARLALLLTRRTIPLVLTSHGGDLYGLKGELMGKLKRWVANGAGAYCVVSSAMREYSSQFLLIDPEKTYVCPMGVDLDSLFIPVKSTENLNNRLIFVGRLVEKKGVRHLIHAVELLNAENKEVSLAIVGGGPLEADLKDLVKSLGIDSAVQFLGSTDNSELPNLFRSSNLAVFPFIQAQDGDMEGLGLVVVEAMGTMCPVMVGDVPAVHDLVTNDETGIIMKPQNHRVFADKIWELLNDQSKQTRLTETARRQAVANYSWGRCAGRYVDIYKKLIAGSIDR